MQHVQAAERRARRARWRSPPSARPSRRPACCSAPSATMPRQRPTAPGTPSPRPASCPTSATMHFIARAITPPRPAAALRHPLLHRRRQRHRAPHRRQGRPRCRADRTGLAAARRGIKQRIELLAITEIVLRGAERPHRRRASATTCRCRTIEVDARQAGAGTAVTARIAAELAVSLTFAPRTARFRPNRRQPSEVAMAKAVTTKIKLVSSADTGFYYVTKKNSRTMTEKLKMKKYDPIAKKHVEFVEGKIK